MRKLLQKKSEEDRSEKVKMKLPKDDLPERNHKRKKLSMLMRDEKEKRLNRKGTKEYTSIYTRKIILIE